MVVYVDDDVYVDYGSSSQAFKGPMEIMIMIDDGICTHLHTNPHTLFPALILTLMLETEIYVLNICSVMYVCVHMCMCISMSVCVHACPCVVYIYS